jgi:RNA polymerase sigma factor (sigma-70 family)
MTMHRHTDRVSCAAAGEQRDRPRSTRPRRGDDVAALVRGAARGEQRAWGLLVARFSATIRAIARRHRLSEADQQEVAQRTWLCLVEHIESVREPAALGGWLATTARRECLRVLAASRREIPVDEPPGANRPDPISVEDVVSEAERRAALHRALDALPARQRTLMRTLLSEPALSFDDMSAALGMPRGSLGPTHGRSLARLRRDPHLARVVETPSIPVTASRRVRAIGHDLGSRTEEQT